MTELIDRRDAFDLVTAIHQNSSIACEGRRIAGYRDHDRHLARRQLADLCLRTLPGGSNTTVS